MDSKNNPNQQIRDIVDRLQRWGSRINADIYFRNFCNQVVKNKVLDDGTDDLLNLVDQYITESSVCFKEIEPGIKLYRARIIHPATDNDWGYEVNTTIDIPCGFNEAGSREPPLGISKDGRNNLPGMSYLYLSNSPETACAEVKPIVTEILSLAEFLVTEPFKIVDFSDNVLINHIDEGKLVDLGQLFMNIMGQFTRPIKNSAEYKATQILTDHIRKTGIDGIAYSSYYSKDGINYTIFNSKRSRFKFIKSRIVRLQKETRTFMDFENKEVFICNSIGEEAYNQESAEILIEKIKKVAEERNLLSHSD